MKFTSIYFFEDDQGSNLAPITAWNAPWELLLGSASLITLASRHFPNIQLEGVRAGDTISIEPGTYLFLNSRLLSLVGVNELSEKGCWTIDSHPAVMLLETSQAFSGELWPWLQTFLPTLPSKEINLKLGNNFWDYIHTNGQRIRDDVQWYQMGEHKSSVDNRTALLEPGQIYIGTHSDIAPGVVLDARTGPIIIEDNVSIGANAVITGPVFIDKESTVNPLTTLRPDVSLGFHTKVGGEVASTIMMPFSNKGHYGYLGRSMVGSWCNLGAGSSTSTLKNTYGPISFESISGVVSSGLSSLGCLIGDHVKIGTNTVLPPGASVGAYSNIFGSGSIPRFLPAFSWLDTSGLKEEYRLPKVLEVVTRVLARRKLILSPEQQQRIEKLFVTSR